MRAETRAGRPVDIIIHADVTHLEAGPRICFVYRLMQARPAAVNGEALTPASAEGSFELVTVPSCEHTPHSALDQHHNPGNHASFRHFESSDLARGNVNGKFSL